ncbi:MAG: glycogen debranching protein GlgX, partial [Candidatus Binatia bacterium]
NWGVEGPTEQQDILELRDRVKRDFLATLICSQGVPMIAHGDEIGRTQRGNNNAYCQDNELSWVDWNLTPRQQRLLEYTIRLVEIRRQNPVFRRRTFFGGRPLSSSGTKDVTWLRADGSEMTEQDWHDPKNHLLGMLIDGQATDEVDSRGRPIYADTLALVVNGGGRAKSFTVPKVERPGRWYEMVRTSSPERRLVSGEAIHVAPHALALLRYGEERRVKRTQEGQRR